MQRPVRCTSGIDRRIAAGRETRDTRGAGEYFAFGVRQYLLSRDQRRERQRHGGRCSDRSQDLFREHGQQYHRAGNRDKFRQGSPSLHLADDPIHDCDGAVGFPDQRIDQAELARGVLFLARRCCRAHPGNAADDCISVSVQGCPRDVEEEGDRQAPQLHPELRRHGVLCTDKTGTLTLDRLILERYCDVMQNENEDVLLDAYLIAHFQTGLKNVLDRAVLKYRDVHAKFTNENYRKVDEIPFDFSRRMMSVVVETPDKNRRILTKGAPESVFPRCSFYELEGEIYPMEPILIGDLMEQHQELSADGFRVLAVAHKNLETRAAYSKDDESELVLKGYVAFLDPPKDTAAKAIEALRKIGVTVKVLTGDNDLVTRKICHEVGITTEKVLLGTKIEPMTEDQLAEAAESTDVFARLSPAHKQRIIRALQRKQHVVGFMGDGINDAPALRAADVGISVDSGVDIAKESATLILLEKSLMVLIEGVIEGRKVFVNILKYIRMGASSNFGNMFSVLGASAFLPYVPMAPLQVLTNNLLYDFSQVPIPTDSVGPEETAKPRPWHIGEITKFILLIGPISSIFDYTTYFVMLYVFDAWDPSRASLFQTGWFVESLMTQTLIIHVIRTKKIPFIQGRAS